MVRYVLPGTVPKTSEDLAVMLVAIGAIPDVMEKYTVDKVIDMNAIAFFDPDMVQIVWEDAVRLSQSVDSLLLAIRKIPYQN